MLDLNKEIIILDGGMGTMLQQAGVPMGKVPEALNLTHPDTIIDIHRQYIAAGSDIIYANTFSANRYKLSYSEYSVEEIVTAGVQNARKAAEGSRTKVALDVGPIGELMEPNGNLKFEDAYDMFKEMMIAGEKAGAEVIVIETSTDLLEMKAAVLAARENTKLPVFSTMTFERNGRTFTGVTVEAAALTLTGLGVDAIGINCSLGPDEIYPLAEKLMEWTPLPVIIKANAGLPNLNSGGYDISAEAFASQMEKYMDLGIQIIGGCCGTTPEYIRQMKAMTERMKAEGRIGKRADYIHKAAVCSSTQVVPVDGVRIIGERINPTGKKLFKEALLNHNMGYILTQGISQVEAGAHILDVNVGLPKIDEAGLMVEVIKELQGVVDVPLQLDSSNASVIEQGLRIYNGKPIVNSVNGEDAVLDKILPLVKKYGAAVVGLTLDENGIPLMAEERYAVAEHIVKRAEDYGIPKEDVYIDCLTLTASAQQKEVVETLKALQLVKAKLGVKTVLGVSNISFGLPKRELVNVAFLTLALAHGLDLPIINPNVSAMMAAIDSFNVLYNKDEGSKYYVDKYSRIVEAEKNKPVTAVSESTDTKSLECAVLNGIKEYAGEATKLLLQEKDAIDIVNTILIPALDKVGIDFESGKLFLPQLIQSATAAQEAFDVLKEFMAADKQNQNVSKGKIIVATVKGDIHDIGKNIVKVVMENYGYEMIDLGKDVPASKVVDEVKRTGAKLVGLSALMTTTVVSMEETIQALRDEGCDCKIWVGGAVMTEDYARQIGADFYAKDAKQSVDIAKKVLG
ncbi:MAG: homocysteine S-methyltransferase family protein [Lachnospiraceae bacterium]|nr:homocysteine S-methyltransferase family protein [Lachnospiraceae bacterium]